MNRKTNRNKPTGLLSYDEALRAIRGFLQLTSKYTVEELQDFSSRPTRSSHGIHTEYVTIPAEYESSAADIIIDQLGPNGIERVGGKKWWQWRGPEGPVSGEWIEMRKVRSHEKQPADGSQNNRVVFYIHGGAYFFCSVDTHRPQLERYARHLQARVFAVQYRLAPQFPFPCALQDCLAAYLYLLKTYGANEIIIAGDSAGGGLTLALLCTLRDKGMTLPAGGVLISPWVDLTHSFPSVAQNTTYDYLPPMGFRSKPSRAWPPPNEDELPGMKEEARKKKAALYKKPVKEVADAEDEEVSRVSKNTLSFVIEGRTFEVKDQIQMYTPNGMLNHPLVSPVSQPSLGGLPPLLVLCGGGEMLRDEQIYIAHKATNPKIYPPSDAVLDEFDPDRTIIKKYKPTYVQLQVWDDICHAAPTLTWTKPAKYMFRSITQFGAWALSRAQDSSPINIVENNVQIDDGCNGTITSRDGRASRSSSKGDDYCTPNQKRAWDPIPPFHRFMIRQRIDTNGYVHPLDRSLILPVLQRPRSKICSFNFDLVRNWLATEEDFNRKFSKVRRRVRKQIIDELVHGYYEEELKGETPPLTALVARRPIRDEEPLPKRAARTNCALILWNRLTNTPVEDFSDEHTMQRKVVTNTGQAPGTENN